MTLKFEVRPHRQSQGGGTIKRRLLLGDLSGQRAGGRQLGDPALQVRVERTLGGQVLEANGLDHTSAIEGHEEAFPAADPAAACGPATARPGDGRPVNPTAALHLPTVGDGALAGQCGKVPAEPSHHLGAGGLAGLDERHVGRRDPVTGLDFGARDGERYDTDTARHEEGQRRKRQWNQRAGKEGSRRFHNFRREHSWRRGVWVSRKNRTELRAKRWSDNWRQECRMKGTT